VKPAPKVLYCHCAHADVIPAETRTRILEALAASGAPYEAVADLCERAARKDPLLARLAGAQGLQIIACWPRTVRWLFAAAGAPLPADAVIHNMRKDSAEVILADAGLQSRRPGRSPGGNALAGTNAPGFHPGLHARPGEPAVPQLPTFPAKGPGEWIPWFPVLDYDRCQDCRQCLQFCLFGVYTEDEAGKVRVAAPEKCKTGCPACARLCPHVAIIFPKYEGGPISGDDALPAADAGRPPTPIDFSSLAGLDLHEALKRRQAILRAAQGGMPRPSLPGHADAPPSQACPRKDGVGMPPGQQGMPPGQRGTPPDRSGDRHG
jgi:NAD-dependent dihydropyrimidine dehydrogenase PreA subunit